MNGLFGNNIFFLFLFACITIMNYSRMVESQKIILFYLLTFGLAILKVISVMDSILYLTIVSFFYLEFLTEDVMKIKFVKKLKYKITDFIFLMIVQYKFFLFLITLILTSTRVQTGISNYFPYDNWNINLIMDIFSILVFFITIFKVSKEQFKIRSFTSLLSDVFIPPINESDLIPYKPYFEILIRMEDKTFYLRENSYNILSFDFIWIKIKQYWNQTQELGFEHRVKEYFRVSQVARGYSTLEMQLLRTVALESGYYKTITRKIFEILYTNIIFKSMKEYYENNNYVNNDKFKDYLLSIYISNVRTKIDGVVFTKMTKYLGDKPEFWEKEKFYLSCLGLTFQPSFSEFYVYELYNDLIDDSMFDTDKIRLELEKLSTSDRNYYGGDKK
ncbi:hypothetical protein [Enterococcus lemanii]|uniref:Uncharacterized protein n=1 Tax=Enterococcus lemanii TaxID=1159752 RepID=A0ABV9MZG4_9ENTE|nr:hypothetical protein [Enterococcus lemanii]MBM7708187.1 hypothetical protein [Enterococcus lemanii]